MIAEKAFIGSIIKADYLLKDTVIRPDQLEDSRNRSLFKAMLKLQKSGKAIDLITLTTLKNLESIGGVSYLNELASHADVERFSEIEDLIIDAWKEREKKNILVRASEEDWPIEKVTGELDRINQIRVSDHTSITDALSDLYEAPWEEKEFKKGATTGIRLLNEMTNGWQNAELTIIAARPSMGKTDVMLHFAKQAGWAGYLPLVFSLEMPEESITMRLIASTGRYNRGKMKNPNKLLTDEQKKRWSEVIGRLGDTHIQIFDGAGQSVSEMRAKTRKMMNDFQNKKPVVFIDYLTLIKPKNFYNGNAHLQVTEISNDLKNMAKDFNCPVVCLAQLNRSVENRADKRPMMSDIRESGSVEQDADVIIFLYRDKYYNKENQDDTMEMIVAKNRNGPVGPVKVEYNEHTGAIKDVG